MNLRNRGKISSAQARLMLGWTILYEVLA